MSTAPLLVSSSTIYDCLLLIATIRSQGGSINWPVNAMAVFVARPHILPVLPVMLCSGKDNQRLGYLPIYMICAFFSWARWLSPVFAEEFSTFFGQSTAGQLTEVRQIVQAARKSFLLWVTGRVESPNNYSLSLGIRWYLDAQMLPDQAQYFEMLLLAQPVICCYLIYYFISPLDQYVAVDIAVAVVTIFKRGLTMLDVCFAAILLCRHTQVVKGMRHVPLICAGIVVPIVVSPLMASLWVDYGTGNANYCFFQGLCLWLFCAFGIAEFTNAFLKLHHLDTPPLVKVCGQ